MKTNLFLLLTLTGIASAAPNPPAAPAADPKQPSEGVFNNSGFRVWHDSQGRGVDAKFIELRQAEGGPSVVLQRKDGRPIAPIPLARFAPEDQEIAKNLSNVAPDGNTNFRTWHLTDGNAIPATFRGMEEDKAFFQTKDGFVYRVSLEQLTPADQELVKTMKPEGLGIPSDPQVAQAASRIDQMIVEGLKFKGMEPNALASDEQFVRRVYLDLVGRIPTREEIMELLADTSPSKRSKVIDKLIRSEGFTSRMFNYFSDMLRMSDTARKAKFFSYEEWFKDQLAHNRPYDQIVHDMMTASGKLIENGATGYLLRDKGMRLDNLSVTLSTFLGANVACAQCHDHPFSEWTQRQFYEMAAFFGHTETYGKKGKGGGAAMMEMGKGIQKELTEEEKKKLRRFTQVNALHVYEAGSNDVKLPDDYKYPSNGKPGEIVYPKLIVWPDADLKKNTAYLKANTELQKKGGEGAAREIFADWMTSSDNPRFAMTIANRMWKLMFGIGLKEPITDLDDPNAGNNPRLLYYLAGEMKRLKFDMRAFMRVLANTQTYQREAITKQINPGEPYYFPGPILRRMSAEQAWDSCVTLAIGEKVDGFKLRRADIYEKMMDLKPGMTIEQLRAKLDGRQGNVDAIVGGGAGKGGKGPAKMRKMADNVEEDDNVDHKRPEVLQGLVLARASELPQPEKDQHFLRMFGQSDRQVADTNADEGSIPQVLMLMNGEAQLVLRNPKARVLATAMRQNTPEEQIESLYLSFLSRHPEKAEMADAKTALKGGLSISDLTWVLFNSREFMFVQ